MPFTTTSQYSLARSHQAASLTEDYDDDDDEQLDRDHDLYSPSTHSYISHTPKVVYGEACIVDVQSPLTQWVRKVKSVDCFYPKNSISQVDSPRSMFEPDSRPRTSAGRVETDYTQQDFSLLPRTPFVRASQTTIKRSQTPNGSIQSMALLTPVAHVLVDRGTDACNFGEGIAKVLPHSESVMEEEFAPIFPPVEDLIIHFTNDHSNKILDSVFDSYRNGSYPIFLPSPDIDSGIETISSPVLSPSEADNYVRSQSYPPTATNNDDSFHQSHEFDPYSSRNEVPRNAKRWAGQNISPLTDSAVYDLESTPPATPQSQRINSTANKFCDFSPANQNSVIGVQNSLRRLLSLHFPAGENGYTQHYCTVNPSSNRLWKPVWRNEDPDSASTGIEGRNVDLVVALGCEDGVKEDFFASISGQVERLGMKREGLSRSGRLDIKYLFALAMQNYSNVLLDSRSFLNPLTPSLLATLIIPQLEAYLANNSSIRFLVLTYPASHLATVLALRKIISQDVFKIAGILDSLSSDPPSFANRPRTPTTIHPLSNEATITPPRKPSSQHSNANSNSIRVLHHQPSFPSTITPDSSVSFSKANYLLPSMATEAEVTHFLSSIRTNLLEKSPFYSSEPQPAPMVVEKIVERFIEKPNPPPPPTPTSPYSSVSYRTQSKEPRDSKISRLTGGDADGPSSKKRGHHYTASISSTVHTTGSEIARRDRRNEEAWENFYIGEEDSDDDAFDRMIMGRAGARIVPEVVRQLNGKKRSSKKALKWLGLA